jgi:hypothetical protein
MRKGTSLAIELSFPFKNDAFQEFETNSTPSVIIDQIKYIWELGTIEIFFKFSKFSLVGILLHSLQILSGRKLEFLNFTLLCDIKILISNKSLHLEIDEVEKLFPSHPVGQSHNDWHIADLHLI